MCVCVCLCMCVTEGGKESKKRRTDKSREDRVSRLERDSGHREIVETYSGKTSESASQWSIPAAKVHAVDVTSN